MDIERILAEYTEQGYARLGVVAKPHELAVLRARIDALMMGERSYPGMFFQKDTDNGLYEDLHFRKGFEGPTLNYRKVEKLELDPVFRAWANHPVFEQFAKAWYGPRVVIYRALMFNKAAQTGGSYLPWHQDGGRFWGLDREPSLQIWTALDDADLEGGCVQLIPRTHTAGLVTPLGGVIQPEHLDRAQAEARAVSVPVKAGEVLLIHNHLWHRSKRSSSGEARRGLTVCYMHADTKCLRTKRAPRVFYRVFPSPDPYVPVGEWVGESA